ncbi:MAG: hypothetical protein OJF50_006466 [Nitrospira sp.]|nr:hypothetical protein [Nitrospira sp.]
MMRVVTHEPVSPDFHRRIRAAGPSHAVMSALLGLVSLMLSACGHYKSDFSCKGYPENSACLPATQVYERRHEQLTHMTGTDERSTPSTASGSASADRVAAIAGKTEFHLGQPNLSQPVVLQVWIAPWRDSKNNLHEAQIVYAMVEQSDWLYGRRPKGMEHQTNKPVFTPQLSSGLFEQGTGKPGPNGGMPMLAAPRAATPPTPASTPLPPSTGSSDPSAILRQLQQQMPQMPGAAPGPGAYGPPTDPGADPETLQEQKWERMQEQRENMFGQ